MLLLCCGYEFYVSGKGTLGWAVCFWSPVLATYTASMAVLFHLRIAYGEQPWLARTHGEQWDEYRAKTPRWFV